MANVVFTEADAARIIRAVKMVEGLFLGKAFKRSRADGVFVPVQMTEDLKNDNHATAKVLLAQEEADPEAEDATFELNVVSEEEVTVYPWAIPADKMIASGQQIWAMWWDGQLYSAIVEDCLVERVDEEE